MADTFASNLAAYPACSIDDQHGRRRLAPEPADFGSLLSHRGRITARIERAASGGALIAMAADFRRLEPTGQFFLHRPSGPYAKSKLDEVGSAKAGLMASRCRGPAGKLRQWMDAGTTIAAPQALAYGLVHEVPGLPKPRHPTVFL